jgi:hypothetical protein
MLTVARQRVVRGIYVLADRVARFRGHDGHGDAGRLRRVRLMLLVSETTLYKDIFGCDV